MSTPERQHGALLAGELVVRPMTVDRDARPAVCFPPDHPYLERCWLPFLGPSAAWCYRRLTMELTDRPDGFRVGLVELAHALGLGTSDGRSAPLPRVLARLEQFGFARVAPDGVYEVRPFLPTLGQRLVERLGTSGLAAHREMVAEAANPLLSAALAYARRGWPVLPLRPEQKVPDGRLVPHGLNEATTDEARIRSWWAAAPTANVGIRTGLGLDVVDLDSEAARTALVARAVEPLSPSIAVRTARGWHLWFASSGLSSRAGVLEGMDVRGQGGYVVAPPSRHPDGHRYELVDPTSGEVLDALPRAPLRHAPDWLIELCRGAERSAPSEPRPPVPLRTSHYVQVAVDSECQAVSATPEGSRNHRLNQAAFSLGTLVGARVLDADDARTRLLDAALAAGLDERESLRTIASGLSAGERQPRAMTEARTAEGGGGTSRRASPDPRVRPADAATAAVLARVRHDSKSKRQPPAPPPPQRGIGR